VSTEAPKKLKLKFHGRVIDHLGIQMYQSPVAAIAELISNAWDADAEEVKVTLPSGAETGAVIIIEDSGNGMTFEECQDRYLNVGYDCREGGAKAKSSEKQRPVLGRKGIGKFAGFGIAQEMVIETTSKKNGERTVFELSLKQMRGEQYIEEGGEITVSSYSPPSEQMKQMHGTKVTLRTLSLQRAQNPAGFARSMSRRFLLAQRSDDFRVLVNGDPIPSDPDIDGAEFVFPISYEESERPTGIEIDSEGWGNEDIGGGRKIRWRIQFYKETIKEDELRGVSVFANGKLAQQPFTFNIIGGISGQQGLEYLSGRVEADYIDALAVDLIATERQRINWEHPEALPLLTWGKKRVDDLCRLWKEKRAAEKIKAMESKLATFSSRLLGLPKSEQKTLRRALSKLAQVSALTTTQFEELGGAILTSWEGGRLKELINSLADSQTMNSQDVVNLLMEANVLTALNTYEAVQTKIALIDGLRAKVEKNDLELAVRDYIACHPWLISPKWETFKVETSLKKVLENLLPAKIRPEDDEKGWSRRIDLILGAGQDLLIIEFMQPGKSLDIGHIGRFEYYVNTVRTFLETNTGGQFRKCTGYLIASAAVKDAAIAQMVASKARDGMYYLDWYTLLAEAEKQYEEFMQILREHAPEDTRLQKLRGE
jgi:signal transduction histidine kinase